MVVVLVAAVAAGVVAVYALRVAGAVEIAGDRGVVAGAGGAEGAATTESPMLTGTTTGFACETSSSSAF